MRFLALALLGPLLLAADMPLIVDTDAGADDLIALLWLLRQPDIQIEAVTIAEGLAHPDAGAESVLRVLEAGGRTAVPVFIGRDRPVSSINEFPAEWRTAADRLLRNELPAAKRRPEPQPAAKFLAARLLDPRRPVHLLALGPLTNIARALALEPRTGHAVKELIWMGGAVDVPGNVPAAPTAEWNAWIDPEAAERVLARSWEVRIVPLDATSRVPIGPSILKTFEDGAQDWAATAVLHLLRAEAQAIHGGRYFAWDVLAAMSVSNRRLLTERMAAIAVRKRPHQRGRLVRVDGAPPNALVAVSADPALFQQMFLTLLP